MTSRAGSNDERRTLALKLRAEGVPYRQVAEEVGVSMSTVVRWLRPDYAERNREMSRRWKDSHREANRARDRDYMKRDKEPCACGKYKFAGTERCGHCEQRHQAHRRRLVIERLWADGLSLREIADRLGMTHGHVNVEIARMRELGGYVVPHRYHRRVAA
jgi:transposase